MRAGNRNISRNRKTSGTPYEKEGEKSPSKGRSGNYRPKREGDAPSGDRPARKTYGDRPFSKPGRKPFGDKARSFGKPDDRFSKDKPRFSKEGGTRTGGFKKPYGKFSGASKPDWKKDDAASDGKPSGERPERSYRGAKPFAGPGGRKPYGDKPGSFGKPGGRFQKDKPRYSKEGPGPDCGRTEGFKKTFEKFSREPKAEAAPGDKPKWNRKESHEFYGERKKRPRSFSKPKIEAGPKESDGSIRLNKYISNAGICSRREADALISAGVISVNGETITTLGYKVQPTDVVKYNDAKLKSEKPVYLLLNKPKDVITTVDDPQNRSTVMSLIRHACKERVYPVGRLDRNTTGLLLFTNDGDLADKLTHPSFQVQKVYEVHLDKNLKQEDFEAIGSGLTLEDGLIQPDEISYAPGDKSIIGIELHSGRNRIVRRIFEHLGYRVTKLDRVLYAGLTKKDLPRGKWRFLTEMELANLKMITGNKRFKAAPKRIAMAEE